MAPCMPFLYVKDNRKVIDFCLFHKQKIKNTPTKFALHAKTDGTLLLYYVCHSGNYWLFRNRRKPFCVVIVNKKEV